MRKPTVAILGAGAGGLCMGVQLHKAGFRDFTIFEKSDRVGGTWHDNTYPGAACDVPSHLYSFSFEPKTDWSRKFSPQAEIEAYFQHVAEKWGLLGRTRFDAEVTGATFDEARGQWRLRTRAGEEHVADALVSGLGQLNRPHVPDFPGLASFEGATWHSARWNHDYDLTGKRVAVIGNAASALQFIPHLAREVAHLSVFQRTPNYVIPRFDREYTDREKWAFANVPGLERLYRWWIWARLEANFFAFKQGSWLAGKIREAALQYLEAMVADPKLRAALTPDYPVGCKRLLISDDYFQALVRPNVELVTDAIEHIEPHAVATRDGRRHPVDAIVFATGFDTTHFLAPLEIEGRGGAKLRETWQDGAEAHLGVTVAGFPNLFLLYGPNTNLGHNSILFMIECQVRYAIRCLEELARRNLAWIDVRRDAMARYNAEIQEALRTTAWNASCGSWYKTETGRITNNWKGFTTEYWWRTRRPDFAAFELRPRAGYSAYFRRSR
jgi:cation diffusion facilitator CzcD-associated flavoprotein CzcO